jgi:heterodisulfide reductase subunit D
MMATDAAQGLLEAVRSARAWACYDCGKCTAACPVARGGGTLSPRRHVLTAAQGDVEGLLASADLFSCLTCRQCSQRCPAEVDYTTLVMNLRAVAHDAGMEPTCPHGGALQSLMRMMALGGAQQDRMGWLDKELETLPDQGEVFYWTGCTMYYDTLFPQFEMNTLDGTRAAVRLMNRLGVTPVVSPEERCCGHDLLWNGDRENFERLARHNVALVEQSGAKTLVTSCAECLRTWRIDYAPFFSGPPPQVVHISEWLVDQMPGLDLQDTGVGPITYQDPCRMGRHLGVYEAPRRVLDALPGVELREMGRSGPGAVCCAGGTWSNCDRFAKNIQVDRLKEARSTGAQVMVTACPKCRIHFRCAMQDPELGDQIGIEMRDVAEMVADALT